QQARARLEIMNAAAVYTLNHEPPSLSPNPNEGSIHAFPVESCSRRSHAAFRLRRGPCALAVREFPSPANAIALYLHCPTRRSPWPPSRSGGRAGTKWPECPWMREGDLSLAAGRILFGFH